MIRHFLTPAALLLLAYTASAQASARMLAPIHPQAREARAAAAVSTPEVMLSEDFSKMRAGSESNPDSENIADKRTGVIPSNYTSMPGWTGAAIYQAGGACAIRKGLFSDGEGGTITDTGFLRTPQGAYSGDLTVSFRARLIGPIGTDEMDLSLLTENGRLESATVTVTPEWQSFEVDFTKGAFTGCVLQMTMTSAEVLVDDIVITSVQRAIPAPLATEITNYREDGFTANWERVAQADSYLVTVYEKKVEEAKTVQDFEGLNVIEGTNMLDKSNPGFSDGWDVVFGNVRNADHVSPNLGYEGSTGIIFRATGEGFITPVFDRPIRDFSFWGVHPSGEECLSTLVFSVLVDGEWGALGNYDVERISSEGEIIRLSSNFPDGVMAVQVYFKKNENYDAGKDVSVIMDHICIMTDPEPVVWKKDLPTDELSYNVRGLDPYKDYSFTVRAVNENFSSEESNELTASGLAAPELQEPASVGRDSYTAAWSAVPKAEGYVVSNYRVYNVNKEYETVPILEENFDKVTEGTVSEPVGLYNVVNPRSLDAYTTTPGWMGIATYLASGMVGTRSYMGIMGIIQTPALDLSGNDGNFSVTVRVVGDTDATNEYLVVQAGYEEYLALPMAAGEARELRFDFDCGLADMPLAFYSENGFPFYLDEVRVEQTLPYGSKVYHEVESRLLEGETLKAPFAGLTVAPNEHYAYRAFAYRDFMGSRVFSLSNGVQKVELTAGIDAVEADEVSAPVRYYRLDGVALPEAPSTPGIYLRRQGAKTEKIVVK